MRPETARSATPEAPPVGLSCPSCAQPVDVTFIQWQPSTNRARVRFVHFRGTPSGCFRTYQYAAALKMQADKQL